ncbi:hypothetical protein C8R43DRAFT_946121 [Mycena crocata]|nr:hypothetical protein C8R43DRAFT_946121 [Mycena crocata]
MQPGERIWDNGELSCPADADWTEVRKLHGKNGLVMVMAALLWWGCVVAKDDARRENPFAFLQWERAVMDVTWVLEELQRPIKGKGVRGKPAAGKGRQRKQATAEKDTEEGGNEGEEEPRPAPKRTRLAAAASERVTRARSTANAPKSVPGAKKSTRKRR